MALSGYVSRLGKPECKLFTQIMEKGRNPAGYFCKILAVKTLKANRFLGTNEVASRLASEDLNDPKKIAPGQIRIGSLGGIVFDDLYHASAYYIEGVTGVACCVDRLSRPQMPGLRKLTQCLQFERFKGSAKAKVIPVDHIRRRAGVMQDKERLSHSH